MTLKLYLDLLSQPSRALYILLKSVKCNFEPKYVQIHKGQHISEEYTKVNRLQKVPVIDHNGFVLTESVAILYYLSRENIIPESLFPKETRQQARVQEFLEWQHIGFRTPISMYVWAKYLNPTLRGQTTDPKEMETWEVRMKTAIQDFNTKWLGRGTDFIVGNNITVADLLAACELEQSRVAGFDSRKNYANINTWHKKVREYFNPHYDEAHVMLNKVVEKQNKIAGDL